MTTPSTSLDSTALPAAEGGIALPVPPGASVILALELGFTAAVLFAFRLITLQAWPLSEWLPGTPARYCELVTTGPFREPSNTWSNLGFVLAGVAIFALGARDNRAERSERTGGNPMRGQGLVPTLFGLSLVSLGFGSGLFHAIQTHWAGVTDNMTMMAVIAVPLAYNISRIQGWSTRGFAAAYSAVVALSLLAVAVDDNLGTTFGDLMTVATILTEVAVIFPSLRPWSPRAIPRHRGWVYWLGFVAVGAGARTIWAFSKSGGPLCDPSALVQGHAVWHLTSAVGVFCYYLYLRSENSRSFEIG